MSSTSSNSKSPIKERKRVPIACMICRTRKLRCRPYEPVENSPCERCVKEGLSCEYRPVDQGSASASGQVPLNFPEDNPVNLYPVSSAFPENQPNQPEWYQPNVPHVMSGGYTPNQPYYPPAPSPLQATPSYYATPQYQQMPHSPYPTQQTQHPYMAFPSAYPAGQPSYQQHLPQFGGLPPNQSTSYAPALPATYDYRAYQFDNNEDQMDDSNSATK